jgi:hypothetical protein
LYADELDIIEKDVDEFIGEDKKTELKLQSLKK